MYIKNIIIKNFRSILHENLDAKDLNIIVGNNDVGKSNFLKALNLFFNNQTDIGQDFDFDIDYCVFAIPRRRKAKEIIIEITFQPPINYNKGKNIIWKKVWRKEGFFTEKIQYKDKADIPARSRVKVWLKRLVYKYVPAIKSNKYFAELLRDMHDVLYLTIESQLKKAGENFVKNIEEHTNKISKDLLEKLKVESSIQLPTDLGDLFSTLDFQTKQGKAKISLQQRGDGVKVRYVPIILKFLADHEKLYHSRGAVRSDTIWGYEEPENNLELTKAFSLANELHEYSKKIQIFATTHSPAFYSVGKNESEQVNSFFVNLDASQLISRIKSISTSEISNLDSEMGLLPIITPYVQEELEKNKQTKKELEEAKEKIKNEIKPTLFVEGQTDRQTLKRAISLISPQLLKKIKIQTKKSAGYNYVKDSLFAWAFSGKTIKAAGLFDFDKQAREAKNEVDSHKKVQKAKKDKVLKTILLPKASHIVSIFKKGINISFSIEELFPIFIWKHAEEQGWLEDKQDMLENNNFKSIDRSFQDFCDSLSVTDEEKLYLKKVSDENKKNFSNYVIRLKGEVRDKAFFGFKTLIVELEEFFK